MILLGRFHLIRVVLALIFVILFVTIYTNWHDNSVIHLNNPASSHLSWHELEQLSEVNQTCPICFGKDACHELQNDVSNGVLEVSRNPQNIKELGQTVQGIYRHGKLRFWVKKQSSSPSLMQGFEKYICSKTGHQGGNCDLKQALESPNFSLHAINLDLTAIRELYKFHLVSRRRIPITTCPSWKFVQGMIQSFDDNNDQTLTGEEKVILLTTLATNPEIAAYKFILNQKLQFPVLPYFGACGRLTFIQGPYKPLTHFIQESLALRVNLAGQMLQLVDGFIQDDPMWLLFTRDLNYDSFIVTEANQVFLKDLSYVMLIDKDKYDNDESEDDEKWTDDKFDEFYNDLVDSKDAENYDKDCSKVIDYAGHMFSLVCKFVLSDLSEDVKHRRINPAAKSYPGLLHGLDLDDNAGEEKPMFEDVKLLESLLARCSNAPDLETRHEAGLQLMQELTLEDDEDEDQEGEEDDDEEEENGHDDYEDVQDGPPDGDTD